MAFLLSVPEPGRGRTQPSGRARRRSRARGARQPLRRVPQCVAERPLRDFRAGPVRGGGDLRSPGVAASVLGPSAPTRPRRCACAGGGRAIATGASTVATAMVGPVSTGRGGGVGRAGKAGGSGGRCWGVPEMRRRGPRSGPRASEAGRRRSLGAVPERCSRGAGGAASLCPGKRGSRRLAAAGAEESRPRLLRCRRVRGGPGARLRGGGVCGAVRTGLLSPAGRLRPAPDCR